MVPDLRRLISPVPLSAEGWEPFGWLPVSDTDPLDGSHRLSFEWGDPHVNLIGHARDEVEAVAEGLRCEVMYRHLTHTQVLMPLDHRCVLAVAAPETNFADAGAERAVAAFLLDPLQTVVLHRGTWHWGPFPISADHVQLFNVQGLRYQEDNERADLENLALVVAVRID
jgi:ureidoglycolate hydrolase